MCTVTVAQYILDALMARIKNQSVFTAYDVTKDARDLTKDNVSHRDVRNIVHNEFMTGQFPSEYNQEPIELSVPNNPVAIVYFPDGKSAFDHPLALNPNSAPAPIPTKTTTVPASMGVSQGTSTFPTTKTKKGGSVKDGDGYICELTSENRLNVPKSLLTQLHIDWQNGGTYDIIFSGKLICKAANDDGRVRIAKSELGTGDKYRVSVDTTNNTIVVEQK